MHWNFVQHSKGIQEDDNGKKYIDRRELKRTITFIKLTTKFNFMENFPNGEIGKEKSRSVSRG